MAVEQCTPGFTSDLLVAEMSSLLDEKLLRVPNDSPLALAFPLVRPDSASISYALQALEYGDRPSVQAEVWIPLPNERFDLVTDAEDLRERAKQKLWTPADDMTSLELIRQLEEGKYLHSIVGLLPGVTPWGTQAIRDTISIDLDHDSTSPKNPIPPTTPVGMVRFAEHIARIPIAKTTGRIAILGYGPLVGEPLASQVLPINGVDMDRVTLFKTRDAIESSYERLAAGEFRWVFSAYPAAAKITRLAPGTVMIDAGYAIGADGKACGNAHPDLLKQSIRSHDTAPDFSNGIVVTAFRRGTGPVTIAEVFDRGADYQLQENRMLGDIALSYN